MLASWRCYDWEGLLMAAVVMLQVGLLLVWIKRLQRLPQVVFGAAMTNTWPPLVDHAQRSASYASLTPALCVANSTELCKTRWNVRKSHSNVHRSRVPTCTLSRPHVSMQPVHHIHQCPRRTETGHLADQDSNCAPRYPTATGHCATT